MKSYGDNMYIFQIFVVFANKIPFYYTSIRSLKKKVFSQFFGNFRKKVSKFLKGTIKLFQNSPNSSKISSNFSQFVRNKELF